MSSSGRFYLFAIAGIAVMLLLLPACAPTNPHETRGFFSPTALQRACVSGKVTDAVTGRGIDGALLDVEPARPGHKVATNRDGFYYAEFAGGNYRLRFVKSGYRTAELDILLIPGETSGRDISLEPSAAVVVDAGKPVANAAPGSTVELKATVTARDGSQLKRISWKAHQAEGGAAVQLAGESGPVVLVTLPDIAAYKRALLYRLRKDGRLLNRWMVMGLTPSDLREAGRVTLTASAATSSGTRSDTVDIIADLRSFADVNPGLRNVPVGKPVFLQGADQPSHAWSLAHPPGSSAVLQDAASQNPSFTPDVSGTYTVLEGNKSRLTIQAGQWNGAVVARENELRPRWIGANGCLCHFSDPIAAKFKDWRVSGHAEIFERCVNTIFRYEERCFPCHTVGFGGKASDGGISAVPAYPAFLQDASLWDHGKSPPFIRPKPGNLDFMLATYPAVARLTDVQCENCHGPNNSPAHQTLKKTGAPERVSLAADVCGICHDESIEPSYRQWHENEHSNYPLAVKVATVDKRGEAAGDCGRCHAGQGFLAWAARGDRAAMLAGSKTGNVRQELTALGLTADEVHPVTCAICHEPHNPGSTFRSETEKVPVRPVDPARLHPGEFSGEKTGREAICIACHSTAGGARNDTASPMVNFAAPHASQADVLFGQNAFFTKVGAYKSHVRIEDSCVWCHVKPVPKLSGQGYPRGGASHTFKAGSDLCSRCHKEFEGDELMAATEKDLESLKAAVENALLNEIRRKGGVGLDKAVGGEKVYLRANILRKIRLVDREGQMAAEVVTDDRDYRVPFQHVSPGEKPLLSDLDGQIIAKAAWNYLLLKNDRSKGAHNPQFVAEVLGATLVKLKELPR